MFGDIIKREFLQLVVIEEYYDSFLSNLVL